MIISWFALLTKIPSACALRCRSDWNSKSTVCVCGVFVYWRERGSERERHAEERGNEEKSGGRDNIKGS